MRSFLESRLLTEPDTTKSLLGTIAGSIITVTSITFSLLLLAVQQSAASLTTQVLDQFLRRRLNQFYFGVFVGITLFTLITLATTDTRVTPVFGATVALLLALVALTVLVLLIYTTLNQMRPVRIVEAIHDLTLAARARQLPLLRRTRRVPAPGEAPSRPSRTSGLAEVHARSNGYVADLHLDRVGRATAEARGDVEVDLLVSLGTYVCFDDVLARVTAASQEDADAVGSAVEGAISLERQRNLHLDASYGVSQLATIA